MNWDAIGAIGELIGAAAVVGSLVYVAIQIRQNTTATQSNTQQQIFDATTDVNLAIASDPALSELITRANQDYESITDSDRIQLTFLYMNWFNMWHSAFGNYESGLLAEDDWGMWDKGMGLLMDNSISARKIWSASSHIYGSEFQRHVGEIIEKAGPVSNRTGIFPGVE